VSLNGAPVVVAVNPTRRFYARLNAVANTIDSVTESNSFSNNVETITLYPFAGDEMNVPSVRAVERMISSGALRSRTILSGASWRIHQDRYSPWAMTTSARPGRVPFQHGVHLALVTRGDGRATARVIDPVFPVR
jgi:hypothetical protein